MERRDLLKMIVAATGFAFVGGQALAAGIVQAAGASLFSAKDLNLLDEIAETILPRTKTPGAKDAGCGAQIAVQVTDCYSKEEQSWFLDGLRQLQQRCQKQYQRDFLALTPSERLKLCTELDAEARLHNGQLAGNDSTNMSKTKPGQQKLIGPHYFTLLKQLTIFVFFTSKVGATEVLRYSAIPGGYDGAMPYKVGDRAWAT